MKNQKLKQRIKKLSIVSLVGLAFSPLISSTTVDFAAEADNQNDSTYTTINVGDLLAHFNNVNTS